jgi:hypothetical protein
MKKFSKLILCVVFLFILTNGYSQFDFKPGYYITNNMDTVIGQIAVKSGSENAKACTFRENNSSSSQNFMPGQILAYRVIGDKYYISKSVTINGVKNVVFLEFQVNGCT